MTTTQPLLIELGTEELPVKALPGLAQAFFDGVDELHLTGLTRPFDQRVRLRSRLQPGLDP